MGEKLEYHMVYASSSLSSSMSSSSRSTVIRTSDVSYNFRKLLVDFITKAFPDHSVLHPWWIFSPPSAEAQVAFEKHANTAYTINHHYHTIPRMENLVDHMHLWGYLLCSRKPDSDHSYLQRTQTLRMSVAGVKIDDLGTCLFLVCISCNFKVLTAYMLMCEDKHMTIFTVRMYSIVTHFTSLCVCLCVYACAFHTE
jgi:hypothetical protein